MQDGRSEIISPERSLVMVGRLKKGVLAGHRFGHRFYQASTHLQENMCLLPINTSKHNQFGRHPKCYAFSWATYSRVPMLTLLRDSKCLQIHGLSTKIRCFPYPFILPNYLHRKTLPARMPPAVSTVIDDTPRGNIV
jgi:hypothetical protein